MKKLFTLMATVLAMVAVVALAACGNGGGKDKNYAKDNTKFKIGATGPLTGAYASYGLAVKNSAQLAVDEINAKGGFNGTLFEVVVMDDEVDNAKASTNYSELYESGMQVSLGGVTSGCCLEFGTLAVKDNVFCLTPSATNDDVPVTGVYQMCFKDAAQGSLAAEFINANYPDATVGVFYDSSDDYSKGIYDNFKKVFTKTTVDAAFTQSTKTSFDGQIATLKDCDFIFMPIYYSDAALFIEQAKDTFSDDVVYFGCDGLDGIESVEGFDPFAYNQEISYLTHFNAASDNEVVKNYVKNYTEKYGKDTLNQFGAAAYDCVYAIYNAMVESEKDIKVTVSAAELNDILTSVFNNGFTFSGVTGNSVTWNNDKTVSKAPAKYVVNNAE